MRREERAQQLWSLLALAVTHRQILTYDIVAKLTGVVRPGIGDFLRPIQQYCSENRLLALTSIVVSDDSGLPGEGFIAAHDVPAEQESFAMIGCSERLLRLSNLLKPIRVRQIVAGSYPRGRNTTHCFR